jgi:hypothetical protein
MFISPLLKFATQRGGAALKRKSESRLEQNTVFIGPRQPFPFWIDMLSTLTKASIVEEPSGRRRP